MRTVIELPDSLMRRVKERLNQENITFRAMVISALENALNEEQKPFTLRDAAAGEPNKQKISEGEINAEIQQFNDFKLQSL